MKSLITYHMKPWMTNLFGEEPKPLKTYAIDTAPVLNKRIFEALMIELRQKKDDGKVIKLDGNQNFCI